MITDARRRAEEATRFAERGKRRDPDAIQVAADAWEEAGEPNVARFLLMQLWTRPPITFRAYERISRKLTYPQAIKPGTRLTSRELGQHAHFEFMLAAPPEAHVRLSGSGRRVRAYLTRLGEQDTQYIGEGRRTVMTSPHVEVLAANGFRYTGTCQLAPWGEVTCDLRRGRMWIEPRTGRKLR